jgi:hypothetical protein
MQTACWPTDTEGTVEVKYCESGASEFEREKKKIGPTA